MSAVRTRMAPAMLEGRYDPIRHAMATATSGKINTPTHSSNSSDMASAPQAQHAQRLMRLVKAFQGDVYGDALCCSPALFSESPSRTAEPSCAVFRCRLSPDNVLLFLAVVRIDYVVQRLDSGGYAMQLLDGAPLPFELQITVMSRREWGLVGSDFDIDMLAMDAYRVYVRPSASARLPHVPDAFAFLMSRLRERRFCLSDSGRTLVQNQRAMRRAYAMVLAGWRMDSRVLGDNGWVMGPVSAEAVADGSLNCCLCREDIAGGDVVVRLGCGHVFHYACPSGPSTSSDSSTSSTSSLHVFAGEDASKPPIGAAEKPKSALGLGCWLDTPNGNTCPYCRSLV